MRKRLAAASRSHASNTPAVRTSAMSNTANKTVQSQRRQTARRGKPFNARMHRRQPAAASGAAENGTNEDNHCIICMDDISRPKKLSCGHAFCTGCIEEYFRRCQEKCPTCGKVIGVLRGNQPAGRFSKAVVKMSLPGYEQHKTIRITYTIPDGIQTVGLFVSSIVPGAAWFLV